MLLNDEETLRAIINWESTDENHPLPLGVQFERVAKAQLKKVVGWGNETCVDHNDGTENQMRRKCWRCWQALLEEISEATE